MGRWWGCDRGVLNDYAELDNGRKSLQLRAVKHRVPRIFYWSLGRTLLIGSSLSRGVSHSGLMLAVLRQDATCSVASCAGRIKAGAHFYHYELAKKWAWLQMVKTADLTCAQMGEEAF